MHKLILVNYVSLVVHSDAYKFCATAHMILTLNTLWNKGLWNKVSLMYPCADILSANQGSETAQ